MSACVLFVLIYFILFVPIIRLFSLLFVYLLILIVFLYRMWGLSILVSLLPKTVGLGIITSTAVNATISELVPQI